ncbi:threonine synthase [Xylographa soralifera]|nr:threonine synthase [Xylographa soralifera]
MESHSASQKYLSTRGGSYGMPFEDVVLKGLAADGGLFIPEEIPSLPHNWAERWRRLPFADLAYEVLSLYISPSEIPPTDLKAIIDRSYSTFRHSSIVPLHPLAPSQNLHLLELFHGPTFAFKDVALQFLGNLFEFFLVRRNVSSDTHSRHHLTVIGATSGDTGSAAIYGLRGKKDVSVFILHPKGRVSPIQEAQMTTVLDANVHNLAVEGTFDDCQDMVKALFADPETNSMHNLGAVNSINWARILAQITYYFHAYFSLINSSSFKSGDKIRFVVPTGNFGDVLAGYFAKQMGLPIEKLVVATNENDILDRFWKSGWYEKKPVHGDAAKGGLASDGVKAHEDGAKATLSPAMDILVSSNFERLLWFLVYQGSPADAVQSRREEAGKQVKSWLNELKNSGGFRVSPEILQAAKVDFESECISDTATIETIRDFFNAPSQSDTIQSTGNSVTKSLTNGHSSQKAKYILDPHSAIGVAASLISLTRAPPPSTHHISLATAHPAKFAGAVQLALGENEDFDFEKEVLPAEFVGLEKKERRVRAVAKGEGLEGIRRIIGEEVKAEVQR